MHDYLVGRLSPYKRPEKILRVATIPTTASGKLLKHQLRQMLAEQK